MKSTPIKTLFIKCHKLSSTAHAYHNYNVIDIYTFLILTPK